MQAYLSLVHIADLVFEADEPVLYVVVVSLVGGGHLQVEVEGAKATGRARLRAVGLRGVPHYGTPGRGADEPGRGGRQLHHDVEILAVDQQSGLVFRTLSPGVRVEVWPTA